MSLDVAALLDAKARLDNAKQTISDLTNKLKGNA